MKNKKIQILFKVITFSIFLTLAYYEYTLVKDLVLIYKDREEKIEKFNKKIDLEYRARTEDFYKEN